MNRQVGLQPFICRPSGLFTTGGSVDVTLRDDVLEAFEKYPQGAYVDDIRRDLPERQPESVQREISVLLRAGLLVKLPIARNFGPFPGPLNQRAKYKLKKEEPPE